VGQNKNRFVIGYFAWRVITGKHTQIHLSFMEVGHTRCLVDGHFGLMKKSYRRMDCDTLQHLEEATRRSTANNILQLFAWQWQNWETLVDPLFKPIQTYSPIPHTSGLRLLTQGKYMSKNIQIQLKKKFQFSRKM